MVISVLSAALLYHVQHAKLTCKMLCVNGVRAAMHGPLCLLQATLRSCRTVWC